MVYSSSYILVTELRPGFATAAHDYSLATG